MSANYWRLRAPCDRCPFRNDRTPFISGERAQEIADALHMDTSFDCHKTVDYSGSDEGERVATTAHCAGAAIALLREEAPNQMMRIGMLLGALRLGQYDVEGAPIYSDLDEFVQAHEDHDQEEMEDFMRGTRRG